jgi:hypothetical protein
MKVTSSLRARLLEALRELAEALALRVGRAARGAARDQPLELAPHLEELQLASHVDLVSRRCPRRGDQHELLAREPLQCSRDRACARLPVRTEAPAFG